MGEHNHIPGVRGRGAILPRVQQPRVTPLVHGDERMKGHIGE